jgi:NADPH:quinone reductase-like Zn-dependent oxidoreductase
MFAYFLENSNGPFVRREAPRPVPGAGQVLVRILASGVNPLDIKIRSGKAPHARQPLPAVLGLDMAGVVEDVSPGVEAFHRGDEVYGMIGGVGGLQGTLAEFAVANTDLVAAKPKLLSMRQAAALPLSAITAWEGLVDRARVQSGHKVLVQGGAGGVGHVVVQMARAFGAEVFATVSPDKAPIVEQWGAIAINYRAVTPEQYVALYTNGEGFDIVYDTVGGPTLDACFHALKRYTGHVVSCLGRGMYDITPLSFRGTSYSGVFTLFPLLSGVGQAHHGEILRRTAECVDAGKLTPLLNERRFSGQDIADAYATVEAGSTGKVVVELG